MTKKTKKKFVVISPDGFTIDREATYPSREEAMTAFKVWSKRYERQGYYSSNNGRIPLSELFNYCQIQEVNY